MHGVVEEMDVKDPTELFIAVVAAIGTDVDVVCDRLTIGLRKYDFSTHPLRLSRYLGVRADAPYDERVWDAMTAGDELRNMWGRGDALALHAISEIVAVRRRRTQPMRTPPHLPGYLERHAFVIRSLKTLDELETLRSVYGPRLMVIGAYSPKDRRIEQLEHKIAESRGNEDRSTWAHTPEQLIKRDEKEDLVGGQNVSDTFHRADFFIRGWSRSVIRKDVARTLEILFGSPYRTPTRDEHAQFIATGAALRSAELGRQVGAAITTRKGLIIAVGTNEVPKAGGGSHWEEDRRGNRDFEVGDVDSNRRQFDQLATKLTEQIDTRIRTVIDEQDNAGVGEALEALRKSVRAALPEDLRKGGLKDLTEFGRAMHAEMNALLDAALRGVPVKGATLYTTTFPCHNCARHIIGAGIARVVFIEPYTKSRAELLHGDSAAMARSDGERGKVSFEPFVGVAPRRYLEMFDAARRERLGHVGRRDASGHTLTFDRRAAFPVFSDAPLPRFRAEFREYRSKELVAMTHLSRHRQSVRKGGHHSDTTIGEGGTANG